MILHLSIFTFSYNQNRTAGYKRLASSSLLIIICSKNHILLCIGERKKKIHFGDIILE